MSQIVFVTVLSLPGSIRVGWAGPFADPPKSPSKQSKGDPKQAATLTGCVDEQEGQYLILDERTMNPVANLDAVGFPVESFAKYVGQKVTIRGASISGEPRPVFKVRNIESKNEVCAPQIQ